MLRALQRLQIVPWHRNDHFREEALDAVVVGVAVVADLALDEHLGALRQTAGGQPVHRRRGPDLDLVPGGVVLPLAVLLAVAAGADPQGGDLLAALGVADLCLGAGEADQFDLYEEGQWLNFRIPFIFPSWTGSRV